MSVKNRVLELCEKNGIKVGTLERETGMSNGTIRWWKETTKPNGKTLQAIADYFGVSVDYLLTGEQKEPREENPRVAPFEKLFNELSAEQQMAIVQQMLELRSKQ